MHQRSVAFDLTAKLVKAELETKENHTIEEKQSSNAPEVANDVTSDEKNSKVNDSETASAIPSQKVSISI